MTDFTPTPEARERVTKAIELRDREAESRYTDLADDAIAAFVEAEGLEVEISQIGTTTDGAMVEEIRLVGPWRKRHAVLE